MPIPSSTGEPGKPPYRRSTRTAKGSAASLRGVGRRPAVEPSPGLGQPLAIRARDGTQAFGTGDQDFGEQPGVRGHVGYLTEEGENFEVDYFGISWQTNNSVFDNNTGLRFPATWATLSSPAIFRRAQSLRVRTLPPTPRLLQWQCTVLCRAYQMSFRDDASMNSVSLNLT